LMCQTYILFSAKIVK